MDLSRLVSGGSPFITNVPVYSAATIVAGAVLCEGASGAARGYTLSVATTTGALKNAIGVTNLSSTFAYDDPESGKGVSIKGGNFRVQSDNIPDRGGDEGNDWMPCIINPDALYFAWYSTTQAAATASDTITQGITASTGTVVTAGSSDSDVVGQWMFSAASNSTGAATYSGSLRYVKATVAAASFGILTAMNISTDSSLITTAQYGTILSVITSDGARLRSQGAAGIRVAQGLLMWDVYGSWTNAPMHPLRSWIDNGLDGLAAVKLFNEVYLYDMLMNESIA